MGGEYGGGGSTEWGLVEVGDVCVEKRGVVMEAPGVPTGSVRGRKGKGEGKVGAGEGPRPCRRQKKKNKKKTIGLGDG